jgi:hypothetical protein
MAGGGQGGKGGKGAGGGGQGGMNGGTAGKGGAGMGGGGGEGGGMCVGPVMTEQSEDFHTHTLTITAAQINAGAPTMYTVSNVGHTHTVTLTTADFMTLRAGGTVVKTSTTVQGHDHDYTILCAGSA